MDSQDWLATHFEAHRPHLQAVAYRMLGSTSEAHDAVQEAWLRLSRSSTDTDAIENPGGAAGGAPPPPAPGGGGGGAPPPRGGGGGGPGRGRGVAPADTAAPDDQA